MGTSADCGDLRSRCRKQSYQINASHEAESECGVCISVGVQWLEKGQILMQRFDNFRDGQRCDEVVERIGELWVITGVLCQGTVWALCDIAAHCPRGAVP